MKISIRAFWEKAKQQTVEAKIRERKLGWIVHTYFTETK
jgi:hypothetical protein